MSDPTPMFLFVRCGTKSSIKKWKNKSVQKGTFCTTMPGRSRTEKKRRKNIAFIGFVRFLGKISRKPPGGMMSQLGDERSFSLCRNSWFLRRGCRCWTCEMHNIRKLLGCCSIHVLPRKVTTHEWWLATQVHDFHSFSTFQWGPRPRALKF